MSWMSTSTTTVAKFYSPQALADAVGLTPGRIRQLITAGDIKTETLGREHLIPASEYRRFIRDFKPSNKGRPRLSTPKKN